MGLPEFSTYGFRKAIVLFIKRTCLKQRLMLPQTGNEERGKEKLYLAVSQMSKCFGMEGLECQSLQSPEEARGEQGFWLLAQ